MKHLSANEIIKFVSLEKVDDETKNLCATVNGHIYKCKHCFELVKAYQTVKDGFENFDSNIEIEEYLDKSNSKKGL